MGHSGWFEALMNHVVKVRRTVELRVCVSSLRPAQASDPALTHWFENCELRTMHIVFTPTAITAASPPKAHL